MCCQRFPNQMILESLIHVTLIRTVCNADGLGVIKQPQLVDLKNLIMQLVDLKNLITAVCTADLVPVFKFLESILQTYDTSLPNLHT